MRPLHRPMFRYGGPIKEGVMSGIREPHARGSIAGGNQIGTPMGNRTGFANPKDKLVMGTLTKILPKVGLKPGFMKPGWNKVKSWFKPKTTTPGIFEKQILKTQVPKKGIIPSIKNWYATSPAGKYLAGTPEAKGITYALGAGKGIVPKIVKGSVKSPLLTGGVIWGTDALPGGQPLLNLDMLGNRNIFGQRYDPKTDKRIKGTGISSLWEDEEVKIDDPDKTTETNPWKEKYQALLDEKKVPKKSAEEIRNERIQKYRDIMDIKGMNKEAAYDSLIAASQAINESGDFKGDLRSGKLINQIIQGASKAFDKPKKTKDAIDTLILKGEIEKDIAAAKPTQYELKEDYLTGSLGAVTGKRVSLNKPGTLSDALLLTKGTDSKPNRTSQALRSYFDGYLVPKFEGKLSSDNIDALGGKEKLIEGESISLDDGVYQISKGYILVEGNKIIKQEDLFTGKD